MIRCTCMVQADQVPDQKQSELKAALNAFAERAFSQEATINWIRVPAMAGYTAGALSTSSIVTMTAPEALSQERRVSLLQEICDVWMEGTGCSLNEIVATVSDPS